MISRKRKRKLGTQYNRLNSQTKEKRAQMKKQLSMVNMQSNSDRLSRMSFTKAPLSRLSVLKPVVLSMRPSWGPWSAKRSQNCVKERWMTTSLSSSTTSKNLTYSTSHRSKKGRSRAKRSTWLSEWPASTNQKSFRTTHGSSLPESPAKFKYQISRRLVVVVIIRPTEPTSDSKKWTQRS